MRGNLGGKNFVRIWEGGGKGETNRHTTASALFWGFPLVKESDILLEFNEPALFQFRV